MIDPMNLQINQSPVDMQALAEQLGRIVEIARRRATEPEHTAAIAYVEGAKKAAETGDQTKALGYLRLAGTWVKDIAEEFSAKVAIEAIKSQMGL